MIRYTLLLCLFILSCGNQHTVEVDLLIKNASIIDVQNDSVLQDKLVEVSGKKIIANELNRMTNRLISMVEPMHHAGINLLTGTDSGPTSPYLFPGQSLHEELKLLVEAAGLTPAEALRSSVINGPKFLDHLDSYGSIEKGKMADLVILTKNPLQNIKHTTSVQSVVSRGQFYSEKELSRMISPLKN
ncbi:amidohydrolase family protein [Aliifodinibius sp. S!AR15-10]|uniref:amidohydrolase family protein n=1 Tax=Aliifodinibius sp. S!AR15-10 TaxID=2950437 RepID=UPI0028611638|nr:amidohydrolase family protein [Aliifodinibius sp. S!AR15-10]MDR8391556.1 amidohydrolase family protein [Aliifodinibius sp. S!AR15-10]